MLPFTLSRCSYSTTSNDRNPCCAGSREHGRVSFNECTLMFYRALLRSRPSPLWSPTGCTTSEPDPNSAAACGVSGAPTLAAGLKRRVSSKRLPLFFHFLNDSTSDSADRQVNTCGISVAFYLWNLSDNTVIFPLVWVFQAVISSPLSHWNRATTRWDITRAPSLWYNCRIVLICIS